MKIVGQRILKLLGGQSFLIKAPVTMTFDPVTSRSIGFILISMQNMKTVGQMILKLLGGQGKTDGRPDARRPDGRTS